MMAMKDALLASYTYHNSNDNRIYCGGEGIYLTTQDGERVIDALSGSMNANLGHGNRSVAHVMHCQAKGLSAIPTVAGDINDASIELAAELCSLIADAGAMCSFSSSGSEASETALSIVWKYWRELGKPKKTRVISLDGSYHGCTLGALAITGRTDEHVDIPDVEPPIRIQLPAWNAGGNSPVSDGLSEILSQNGADDIAAIFLEPVMGLAGMIPAVLHDITTVIQICRQHEILVVLDEALTGLGRTGQIFAKSHFGIDCDILLVSKGLGCGFTPIAATILSSNVAEVFRNTVPSLRHGHTSSGNPLSARVALEVLKQISSMNVVENAQLAGDQLCSQLNAMVGDLKHHYVVRATGLCIGLEAESETLSLRVPRVAIEYGLRVRSIDKNIILCPPLIISPNEVDKIVDLMRSTMTDIERDTDQKGCNHD